MEPADEFNVVLLHLVGDVAALLLLPGDEVEYFGSRRRLMFNLAYVFGADSFGSAISHLFGAGEQLTGLLELLGESFSLLVCLGL